jgi:pyrroline-5-carboxylate reductase
MGRALIDGLLRGGWRAEHVTAGEPDTALRQEVAHNFGINISADNAAAVAGASIVILAVKPHDAAAVLQPLTAALAATRPLLISIAAGVRVATLDSWCGGGIPVLRAMPNRAARVGAGATGVYAPPSVGLKQRTEAERVLQTLGKVFWVQAEELLDVVTALSGSGPAYFFLLAELLAESGVELGLDRAMARGLAAATLYGSGLLARGGAEDLARLRQEVTSAGGTTEAALKVFEAADLRATVRTALEAGTQRSRELAMRTPQST